MMGISGLGHFGMFFGFIFMFLFFTGFVLLIIWIVKQFGHGGQSTSSPAGNALEILKERYAKGEISKEEFTEMKKELAK